MLAHTVGAGCVGLIDVDPCRRLPGTASANIGRTFHPPAHRVIEDYDAVGAQRRLDEGFGRGIVDLPYLFVVVEVPNRRRMPDKRKTFAVERETVRDRAAVEHWQLMRFGQGS